MKKETTSKGNKKELNKKALKNNLIETIEKALNLNAEDRKAKKLKKVIRDAAKQITKKYLSKVKDRKAKENIPDPIVMKRRNQRIASQRNESKSTDATINL